MNAKGTLNLNKIVKTSRLPAVIDLHRVQTDKQYFLDTMDALGETMAEITHLALFVQQVRSWRNAMQGGQSDTTVGMSGHQDPLPPDDPLIDPEFHMRERTALEEALYQKLKGTK